MHACGLEAILSRRALEVGGSVECMHAVLRQFYQGVRWRWEAQLSACMQS